MVFCCVAFTATAGSAAEGEVRDPEELGSLLFYLRGCHGIQGERKKIECSQRFFLLKIVMKVFLFDWFFNRTTCASC